jgi:hypothetical protein
MAFTPPNTFTTNTTLTSAALEGNNEALRVYLHDGIISTDLESSKWVQTRHVQPPEYLPYQGLNHGVSGYQGGHNGGGANIRLTFATKFLTGNGRTNSNAFINVPNTSFSLDIRRAAKLLFHYWWEWEVGRDSSTPSWQAAANDRLCWIAPWVSNVPAAYSTYNMKAQETRNNAIGIASAYPIGIDSPFTRTGGYDAKQGTLMLDYDAVGTVTFGLASHSQVDRVGVVNWGVAVEIFYL